METSCP